MTLEQRVQELEGQVKKLTAALLWSHSDAAAMLIAPAKLCNVGAILDLEPVHVDGILLELKHEMVTTTG